ncbi:hypothetical protein [Streptomyces sp. NPDC050485]|uniref:hypothetical protein n=1 Tax=Streptomyces sp. NPDC050485 TaxID=3365617 RepID=UPI0037AC1DE4
MEAAAHSLGLRPQWHLQACLDRVLSVWRCDLADTDGKCVADGVGKGHTDGEARLRALAEALERFLASPAGLDAAQVHLVAAGQLAAGELADEANAALLAKRPTRKWPA